MAVTSIEWTDKVWNPVTGCSKVSQGCKHCYAEGVADRFFAKQYPPNADGSPRRFTDVRCHEDRLEKPLHWRKPVRVFVNSMSDLFHEDVPFEFIDKVFAVMALCPEHTFQILTKRPERMLQYLREIRDDDKDMHRWEGEACELSGSPCAAGVIADAEWPLRNVWLGTSVEDQKTADERIPLLLQTPATVRWVSYEPALGPVLLRRFLLPDGEAIDPLSRVRWTAGKMESAYPCEEGLDWVVCAGESGLCARPMHPDWARSMRDQCAAAGVPFFFKQWGEWLPSMCDGTPGDGQHLNASDAPVRVGKRAAGRLLDGIEHNAYPVVSRG